MAARAYETVAVSVDRARGVATVALDRPRRGNALSGQLFRDLPAALAAVGADPGVRCVVLRGSGKCFTTGIDLSDPTNLPPEALQPGGGGGCAGRQGLEMERRIDAMQRSMTAAEQCPCPVVAAVHGACIGGGIDLACACDVRLASADAVFSVKEVDVAIVADLGTLQRLPRIVGAGAATELALTARDFGAEEAKRLGFVSQVYATPEELFSKADAMAASIAAKSPLAVQGTKRTLLHARDHSVASGLEYVRTLNTGGLLLTDDLREMYRARAEKRRPVFAKL